MIKMFIAFTVYINAVYILMFLKKFLYSSRLHLFNHK